MKNHDPLNLTKPTGEIYSIDSQKEYIYTEFIASCISNYLLNLPRVWKRTGTSTNL